MPGVSEECQGGQYDWNRAVRVRAVGNAIQEADCLRDPIKS